MLKPIQTQPTLPTTSRRAAPKATDDVVDKVHLSEPKRRHLWTAVHSALASASPTQGVAGQLTLEQQRRLDGVVTELESQGLEFFQERKGWSRILGSQRPLEPFETVEALTREEGVQVRQSGTQATEIFDLHALHALDAIYLGADTEGLRDPNECSALRGLVQTGYRFKYYGDEVLPVEMLGNYRSIEYSREDNRSYRNDQKCLEVVDYFHGTGRDSGLDDAEFAARLKQLDRDDRLLDNDPVTVYQTKEIRCRLGRTGQWTLVTLEPDRVEEGLKLAARHRRFLEDELLPKGSSDYRLNQDLFAVTTKQLEGHDCSSQLELISQLEEESMRAGLGLYKRLLGAGLVGQELSQAVTEVAACPGQKAPATSLLLACRELPDDNFLRGLSLEQGLTYLERVDRGVGLDQRLELLTQAAAHSQNEEELNQQLDLQAHLAYHARAISKSSEMAQLYTSLAGHEPGLVLSQLSQARQDLIPAGRAQEIVDYTAFRLAGGDLQRWDTLLQDLDQYQQVTETSKTGISRWLVRQNYPASVLQKGAKALLLDLPDVLLNKELGRFEPTVQRLSGWLGRIARHPDLPVEALVNDEVLLDNDGEVLTVGNFTTEIRDDN